LLQKRYLSNVLYKCKSLPALVKIEGRPDIPFVCSDETYAHFKEVYPLTVQLTRPSDQANDHLQST